MTRVALFEREVRERLSAVALDLLFSHALVLSEGQRSTSPSAAGAFFGSLMITVDLAALSDVVREPVDGALAQRLATHLHGDARLTDRVRAVAQREAERLSQGPAPLRSVEHTLRLSGTVLHIDVEIEGLPQRSTSTGAKK